MLTIKGISYNPVSPSEEFNFHCSKCGECCKHLRMALMLESIDAYRLARYFQKTGIIRDIAKVWECYAEPIYLNDMRYPVFFLKTVGQEERCIFLQDNLCSVQEAKPRTCRLYPLSVNPPGCSPYYALCMEKDHHFKGQPHQVGRWAKRNMVWQERVFMREEAKFVPQVGRMLSQLTKEQQDGMLPSLMLYRYYHFTLEQDFFPQYAENNLILFQLLNDLSRGSKNYST